MGKFDEAFSRGDLVRRVQKLERLVELLMGGSRLTSSSIDEDGLSVKDGFIRWLDAEGNETARFATDGLSLEGLLTVAGVLKMLADANIESYDADGDLRAELGNNLFFRDKTTGEVVQSLGLLGSGEYGMVVEEPDGVGDLVILHPGVFLTTHVNGVSAIRVSGNEIILRYNTGSVAVDLDDDLVIHFPDGTTAQRVSDDRWAIAYPDLGGAGTAVEVTSEFALSGPGTRGVVLRVTEADGLRFAVDTDADGVQSGAVTAGAADSAGVGFRTLRIPN